MDMRTIDSIPSEVLVEIFHFLPIEDLLLSVQFVNKYWQSIIQDFVFWKDVSFRPMLGMTSEFVMTLLEQAPFLRSFEFREGLKTSEIFDFLCEYNPNIVSLVFDIYEPNAYDMSELVEKFPNLEYLLVPTPVFMDNIPLLGKLSKLKVLKCVQTFEQSFQLAHRSYTELEDTDWCALEALHIFCDYDNYNFEQMILLVSSKLLSLEVQTVQTSRFLSQLQHFVKLERLKLNFNGLQIHDPDLGEIFSGFKNLKNLKYLNLKTFIHPDTNILCKMFYKTTFPKLKELDLTHCQNFNPRVAQCIVAACPQLEIFRLKGCVVFNDSCLCELAKCSRLRVLDIPGCTRLSEIGLSYVSSNSLQELNLSWIGFVPLPFLEQIAKMKQLSILRLDNTEVNSASLLNTVKQLPHLKLLSVYHSLGINFEQFKSVLAPCYVRYSKKNLNSVLTKKVNHIQNFYIYGINKDVLNVLPECKNIEELCVDFMGKRWDNFCFVFNVLKGFGKLRSLSLISFVGSAKMLAGMIEGLSLCELELLSVLGIDDTVAETIASISQLEKLNLKGCVSLNDKGLSEIVKIKGLAMLDISGCCCLTEKGLLYLSQCENLQELNLSGLLKEAITDDVLNTISSLPNLKILHSDVNEKLDKFLENENWNVMRKVDS